ncbi:MAG TPA: vanadium-dependent haloperoxidase [Coleofasciculaceae cyanobacterium]
MASHPLQQTATSQLRVKPGFELSVFSDSGVIGDAKTTLSRVTLIGKASAGAGVLLRSSGRRFQTIADTNGSFLFSHIPLKRGKNVLETTAQISSAQGTAAGSTFRTVLHRLTAETIDPVIEWNAIALKAGLRDKTPAPALARNLAVVHTAVYDAVNAITGGHQPYQISLKPNGGASAIAAAVSAAYEVLISLYPNQKSTLDSALTQTLASVAEGSSKTDGINFGKAVADQQVAGRQSDGASRYGALATPYQPGKAPGQWRPTLPNFRAAFLPDWGNVTPFTLQNVAQFRPAPPPALESRRYARDLKQVQRLGAIDSQTRTPEQTAIAQFWSGIGGPVYWNFVAAQIADRQGNSLAENARLFALLNLAEADAGITAWNTKYTYNRWRPIDAIRLAQTDGNPLTQGDRHWLPLLNTPSHPDYISAHSIFSNAAAVVLTNFWQHAPAKPAGDRLQFTTTSSSLPGVRRTYRSFASAAQAAGISRIYGGIHTMTANRTGLQVGQALGNYIFSHFLQ